MAEISELLGNRSAAEVKGWVQRLRYFTFMGAYSTDHFQQDEELAVYLGFDGHDDLVMVLDKLGILLRGDGSPPSVIAGEGPYNVQAFPDLVEPRDCMIAGAACFVGVTSAALLITIGSGVTAARVADAVTIEARLTSSALARARSGPIAT